MGTKATSVRSGVTPIVQSQAANALDGSATKLKSSEFSIPVLGLIFLRGADHKFAEAEKKMQQQISGRRKIGKTDYQADGVLYPEKARFG